MLGGVWGRADPVPRGAGRGREHRAHAGAAAPAGDDREHAADDGDGGVAGRVGQQDAGGARQDHWSVGFIWLTRQTPRPMDGRTDHTGGPVDRWTGGPVDRWTGGPTRFIWPHVVFHHCF